MLNKAVLIGRLTKQPELMQSKNGKKVIQFTLAVNSNNKEGNTNFINCVAWEKTAELIATYLAKGSMLAVEGEIRTRTYEDKSGRNVFVTEVLVNAIHFLEKKEAVSTQKEQQPTYEDNPWDNPDLPF